MQMPKILNTLALVFALALIGTGCGLLESNTDEMDTMRAEIIQLREDVLDLQTEVSLLASVPPTIAVSSVTTTTGASTASPVATTTTRATGTPATTPPAPTTTVDMDALDEEEVLTATYEWGPSDATVVLQQVLGVVADGWYGNNTRAAHVAALQDLALSTDGVPSAPDTTTTEAPAEGETTTTVAGETTTSAGETTTSAGETTTTTAAETTTTTTVAETTTTTAVTTTTAAS
ncbi:MAG: hypothetical protein CL435_04600 [Acidimicrobiaceae bacterium]|jgi:hypothetical protein|nr:hypothetical protein [Acidimicrobiaceae bacterium]HJO79800.1 hypothetical protein [Acidimicrobiales bacterium]|tara:strand:- start:10311 stop:11009 length:699 start_codon:yes stop_codon:yes gene_type:complete